MANRVLIQTFNQIFFADLAFLKFCASFYANGFIVIVPLVIQNVVRVPRRFEQLAKYFKFKGLKQEIWYKRTLNCCFYYRLYPIQFTRAYFHRSIALMVS